MFPNGIEFYARERHKDLRREAERMRLINTLQRQPAHRQNIFQSVVPWFGLQLVKWGLKLQSYRPGLPAQIVTAGAADVNCPQC